MTSYNIYFGTIGKTLGVKYRFTKKFDNEDKAKIYAKDSVIKFYYKNEGSYGLPSFDEISEESDITGISLETLYQDHINDMTRYFVIETNLDSISSKNLIYV